MTTLQYTGEIVSPAQQGVGEAGCSIGGILSSLVMTLEPLIAEFAAVQCSAPFTVTGGTFMQLLTAKALTTVEFIAISLANGALPVDLLIGAPPSVVGVGGTFPTGFTGGETLAFDLTDQSVQGGSTVFTVSTVFTAAAQTAAQVAAEINAAAALAGVPVPPASVVGTQVVLTGNVPGGDQGLDLTTANAALGFPTTGLVLGTGSPIPITKSFVASITATPGGDFWVRGGPATMTALFAGT